MSHTPPRFPALPLELFYLTFLEKKGLGNTNRYTMVIKPNARHTCPTLEGKKKKTQRQRVESNEDCLHAVGAWALGNRLENKKKYKAKGESSRRQFTRTYFGERFSLVPSVLPNYPSTSIKRISQFTYLPCNDSFSPHAHWISWRKNTTIPNVSLRGEIVEFKFTFISQKSRKKKIKHGVNEHRRVLQGAVDFHHWSDGFHGKSASGEATEMLSWNWTSLSADETLEGTKRWISPSRVDQQSGITSLIS